MKICIVCEGSYPYITGGVSTWVNTLINGLPEFEFIIYAIGAKSTDRGKFKYTLPDNVLHVHEIFMDECLDQKAKAIKKSITDKKNRETIKQLITGACIDWRRLFEYIRSIKVDRIIDFFMSRDFFEIIREVYEESFSHLAFSEFFWTLRSMLLPLLYVIRQEVPKADIYHSVSAGYGGVLGALGGYLYNKPYILTEHGIYAREREEEIIKSEWIIKGFKNDWINFFYNLSRCSYDNACRVITLFGRNRDIEIELGCERNKITIIPNGVSCNALFEKPKRNKDGYINIGAVVRVVPIKDIKTMLQAFSTVKSSIDKARLYIMGPVDEDMEYYEECKKLVEYLEASDIYFTGTVNVNDYLGDMDILLLSSISEGQPLAILEGMAAGKPFVATDVGSCRELLYGDNDNFGKAGIVVPVMQPDLMAEAIIKLCSDPQLRETMGSNGKKRVSELYTMERFISSYRKIYFDEAGRDE
ncbi:MAG: GT4 family glycosyltransferase PelF [Clostridia bacterium]|nr:GT4 family glycosyltransferase PelF [Clostridia bacterium]